MKVFITVAVIYGLVFVGGFAYMNKVLDGAVRVHNLDNYTTYVPLDVPEAVQSGGLAFIGEKPGIKAVNAPGAILVGFFGEEDDATPSLYLQPGSSPQVTAYRDFVVWTQSPQGSK